MKRTSGRRSDRKARRPRAPGRRETAGPSGAPRLRIQSYAELLRREKEILKRIAAVRHGGNLFMTHPFLLLSDVGVQLSEGVRDEILEMHPELSGLSERPYHALRQTPDEQSVRFRLHGLFRKRKA